MPLSAQARIMGAVVSALSSAGTTLTPQASAWRTRVEAFDPSQVPAWNVIPDDGEAQYVECAAVDRTFRFCVRCMVSAQSEADLAADPLYVAATSALCSDPSLGGLVRYTREISQKWERDGTAATDNLALVVTYQVEFATLRNDPTTLVP